MRTKLICLMLCLVAVLSFAFTSCGKTENSEDTKEDQQTSARPTVSLNMWVVCEEKVDEETELLVENAFNGLTQSKYTTKVDLIFLTEDEYFETLDENLAKAAEIKASSAVIDDMLLFPTLGEETTEVVETTPEETIVNELGQVLLKYPEIKEGQMDIVFLAGKDLLERYVSEGKLASLEEKLNSSDAKVLKDYIYPSAINQIKVNNGGTVPQAFSIPNNNIIGEYTYLLVNKELAAKYYIDVDEINSFADCAELVADIGNNEKGIAPVLAYTAPVNMEYWLDFATEANDVTFTFSVDNTEVNVFGAKRELPASPVAIGNTVMVPVEFFAKALDASYAYKDSTATATIRYGTRVVTIVADSATATVDGNNVQMAAKSYIDTESGELMVPASFITGSLCATLDYDSANNLYVIARKDFGGVSLLASYTAPDATLGDYAKMDSVFAIPEYTAHALLMQKCKDNGWFAVDPDSADKFGVAIVTGSYEDMAKYAEEYAVKVLSYPALDDEDVYDAMFAITSYTANLNRALEVLTLIYTDKDAKNILQYGVEGVHYEFDDDGNFVVISDKYRMNNNYTGNAFLAYMPADVSADIWENAKNTNLDSRVYPFFGLESAWRNVGANHISEVRKISNVLFDEMENCKNSEELAAFFEKAQLILKDNETFQTAIGNPPEIDPSEIIPGEEIVEDLTTPYKVYSQWGATKWTAEAKEEAAAVEEAMKAEETVEIVEETTEAAE